MSLPQPDGNNITMNPVLVTVVVAVYKSSTDHLRAALSSARAQTYRNLEVIVSDDSPADDLRGLVDGLRDARIRYRHNTPALGVAANHASCFAEARGKYIVILNHDDMLEPVFVERLLAPLESDPTLALAFCDHWIMDGSGRRDERATEHASSHYRRAGLAMGKHQPFFQLLIEQTIPMAMGAMFRRSALLDILPPESGPAYDLWLTYLLCRGGMGAWYVPERLSSWRSHAGNQTTLADIALLRGSADCWFRLARDGSALKWERRARIKASQGYCACAKWYLRRGRRTEGRAYAARSIEAHLNWKAMALFAAGCLPKA